jgi:dipeptidyl aminopeptidase/acylaminoacyl peptidase
MVHGGPTAASTTEFENTSQLMAARDYVVFRPNYRGSDNLGNAYQHAIYNDAGDGPGRDVMAGIDALKKLGFVDESKIAVTGWSYGGFMTTWLIGHYHIWKAAVAGAAPTNWAEDYNISDSNVADRYSFRGSPWLGDNMKDHIAQSSITYAAQIKTPTLILSDTGDARVPIAQSYQLYHATERQWSAGEIHSLPSSRTRARRPHPFPGRGQAMAGLARRVLEVTAHSRLVGKQEVIRAADW